MMYMLMVIWVVGSLIHFGITPNDLNFYLIAVPAIAYLSYNGYWFYVLENFKTRQLIVNKDFTEKIVEATLLSKEAKYESEEAVKIIRDRTRVSADIDAYSPKDYPNYVVLCGRYGNFDYVQTVTLSSKDFRFIVNQLKEMRKYADIKFVDVPPNLKHVVDSELK